MAVTIPTGSVTSPAAPLWVSGSTYLVGSLTSSPASGLLYRCITNTSGTTDPSTDVANWAALGGGVPDFLLMNTGVI